MEMNPGDSSMATVEDLLGAAEDAKLREVSRAVELYDQALALDPGYEGGLPFHLLGDLRAELGDAHGAVSAFTAALQARDPSCTDPDGDAWFNLGNAYELWR